jgi:hypothetical protein
MRLMAAAAISIKPSVVSSSFQPKHLMAVYRTKQFVKQKMKEKKQ